MIQVKDSCLTSLDQLEINGTVTSAPLSCVDALFIFIFVIFFCKNIQHSTRLDRFDIGRWSTTGRLICLSAPSWQKVAESAFWFPLLILPILLNFSSTGKVTVKLELKYFFILTQTCVWDLVPKLKQNTIFIEGSKFKVVIFWTRCQWNLCVYKFIYAKFVGFFNEIVEDLFALYVYFLWTSEV